MGSKADNLKILIDAGFRVPPFIAVDSENFTALDVERVMDQRFNELTLFAVRSSADVEDGREKSFAGHFYSEVGVEKNEIVDAFRRVRDSYKGNKGKVIIQQFIPSQCAGVLFTNEGNGLLVINSNFGLCKTVVEGEACDEYYLSREGKILSKYTASNKKPLVFENGLNYTATSSSESLSENQIKIIVEEGLRIEELFGCPQDIEWCFYNDELYILQSRPITRFPSSKNWVFYDSANIAESYSGVVLPLTHSFAAGIYKKVYENLLIASGASRKRIDRNQHIFSNMVSNFYGRMYYNMNSWYLMMSFMPGYNRNKGNLEGMITSNIRVEVPRSVLPSLWLKFGYPFILVYKLIVFQKVVDGFVKKVRSKIKYYRNQAIENYTAFQCVEAYNSLNKELLEQFHIPVENDFLLMTYLGILRKKYGEEELKSLIAFENVSSKQVDSISELSRFIYSIPELAYSIDRKDYSHFADLVKQFPQVRESLNSYFELYGGRFANELKLESLDIEFDATALCNLLKVYKNFSPEKAIKKQSGKELKGFAIKRFVKYAKQREELRLLRSNCFSIVRRLFRRLGVLLAQKGIILNSEDVFYLTVEEVLTASSNSFSGDYKSIIAERGKEYEGYKKVNPPAYFSTIVGGKPVFEDREQQTSGLLYGRSCTSGVIKGKVRVFHDFSLPEEMDFDIMVARNTDPGWAALIGLSRGIIVENGGILSHAAIVSRELGIPTIIGVSNVTQILKTGQIVEMNGETGEIKIVEE